MKKKLIFSKYGIDILKAGSRYWIGYDAGEIVVHWVEEELSAVEAKKARKSERDAYEVILAIQNRNSGLSK